MLISMRITAQSGQSDAGHSVVIGADLTLRVEHVQRRSSDVGQLLGVLFYGVHDVTHGVANCNLNAQLAYFKTHKFINVERRSLCANYSTIMLISTRHVGSCVMQNFH